jgi:hypothetical protein
MSSNAATFSSCALLLLINYHVTEIHQRRKFDLTQGLGNVLGAVHTGLTRPAKSKLLGWANNLSFLASPCVSAAVKL